MNKFDRLRKYVEVRELYARWSVRPDSTDLHVAVMEGVLKPCIWAHGEYQEAAVGPDGQCAPLEMNGKPIARFVNSLCYPFDGVQIGLYEVQYRALCDQTGDVPRYLIPAEPVLLSGLIASGVVTVDALAQAEEALQPGPDAWQQKSAATKTIQSQARIIAAMLRDGYGYGYAPGNTPAGNAGARDTLRAIVEATGATGKPMHPQTVWKYLNDAVGNFPASMEDRMPKVIAPAAVDQGESDRRPGSGDGSVPVMRSEVIASQLDSMNEDESCATNTEHGG